MESLNRLSFAARNGIMSGFPIPFCLAAKFSLIN